ncbi:uncharacterized protein NP_6086A (plasmid) [Natronomonas pharaonis DSM 2160]|uniref:Uncharacterized protein n=1 Tax=Natronomonas pharaonis (strain ATCC 35678 / DSM 2160 / CIP 103997 / JCM 8858 / NBRC 14720 / NCIMB 2260 / Gabara) TaxID=348780 RepID=Q3IM42_NATPD|nr:hypothetical protein [Natronomonas pharaonis]CAI50823.1 uncharacterized protein NP_6086A [Natronomonas pharaonis DSM 2160]
MRRRALLAATGTACGVLAGCLDIDSRFSGSPADARESLDLAVPEIQLRTSYLYPTHPDAAAVRAGGSDQFIFLDVATESTVSYQDISLQLEGEAETPVERVGRETMDSVFHHGWMADSALPARPYEGGDGLVGFSVPRDIAPVESATLVAETKEKRGEWSAPAETVAQLHTPPEFEASLSLPEEIVWESTFEAELSVTNDGGRAGVFVAVLGVESAMHPNRITTTVPAGETETWTTQLEYPSPFEGGSDEPRASVTYELDSGEEVVTATTTVVAD